LTVLSGDSIRERSIITPFSDRTKHKGMTFGLGPAGYDVRIARTVDLFPGNFSLASTMEQFTMPNDLLGIVHDKSTWARRGIALQNTVIEPGWRGFLTLEISNHSYEFVQIEAGMPIAQIIFHLLDKPATPYAGKYQDQKEGPQEAIFEV
jgi:dCTP deaminase